MAINHVSKTTALIWIFLIIPGALFFSIYIAKNGQGTDFPVYYAAAKKMVDPQSSIEEIYQTKIQDEALPEKNLPGNNFIYSPVIAALLSPLGFLPYYTAKSTFIFLNIMAYCVAIALLLKQITLSSWKLFLASMLINWMPFLINVCLAQVNSFILLLIVGAIFLADLNKQGTAGGLLGFAAMFKIFPLGIAFFLGLFKPKITATCIIIFALALLAPGTLHWFQSMPTVSAGQTPLYMFAKQYGLGWYLLYTASVAFFSGYCLLMTKTKDLLSLSAYSIPAVFAMMPVIQYHHLVILIITYIIVFQATSVFAISRALKAVLIFSALHINMRGLFESLPGPYWSIIVIWFVMSWALLAGQKSVKALIPMHAE